MIPLAVLATLVAADPPVDGPPGIGVDLGVQLGYGRPFGYLASEPNQPIRDLFTSVVPLAVDASYRVERDIAVGMLAQYGILQFRDTDNACPPGSSCSGALTVVAAQVTIHAPVPWPIAPWLRLGGGYEWMRLELEGGPPGAAPSDLTASIRGILFGIVQVGAEYHLGRAFTVGPVVGLSLGRYSHSSSRGTLMGGSVDEDMDIPDPAFHEWLTFGVRSGFHL
jgi:hypothetical protein